jgi:MerR family gold-responsive transcriptional activator of gol and ges genes
MEANPVMNNIPSTFNIGQAASASGVSAKMIRHYEAIGITPKALRSDSGYRLYTANDVHTLQFVRRARNLGFSMVEIKKLVGLWRNKSRASADVKAMANQHVKELEAKIVELQEMRDALKNLARKCHGDDRPECPIIDELAQCGH